MCNGTPPAFETNTGWPGLVCPINCGSKLKVEFCTAICGTAPIPANGRLALGTGAFEVTVSVPLTEPVDAGANVTVKLHDPFAATLCWHPFVALGIVKVEMLELILLTFRGAFPQFVIVKLEFSVVPTLTSPNCKLGALKHAAGAATLGSTTTTNP